MYIAVGDRLCRYAVCGNYVSFNHYNAADYTPITRTIVIMKKEWWYLYQINANMSFEVLKMNTLSITTISVQIEQLIHWLKAQVSNETRPNVNIRNCILLEVVINRHLEVLSRTATRVTYLTNSEQFLKWEFSIESIFHLSRMTRYKVFVFVHKCTEKRVTMSSNSKCNKKHQSRPLLLTNFSAKFTSSKQWCYKFAVGDKRLG